MSKTIACVFIVFLTSVSVYGGIWDSVVDKAKDVATGKAGEEKSAQTAGGLQDAEILDGLVEALRVGAERAVKNASSPGGFMDNPAIRIPLPDRIRSTAGALRALGLGEQVDAFEETVNRAAEKAAGEALPILVQAVQDLTFDDVRRLWRGGDTAVTDYFRQKTWRPLYEKFKPVIHATAQQAGVTRKYQSLVQMPAVRNVTSGTDLDLDHYVTENALSGLFTLLAQEEKRIRTDPVARTTDILKKVFGP